MDQGSSSPRSGASAGDHLFNLDGRQVRRIWVLFFLLVLFVLFLGFLWQGINVLLILFAGALIAVALRFLSDTISQFTPIPPLWSLSLVLVLLVGGAGLALYLAAPVFWEQMRQLAAGLQESLRELQDTVLQTETGRWLVKQMSGIEDEMESMAGIWERTRGFFTVTLSAITGLIITLAVAIFLAYNPRLYIEGFLRLIPLERRSRACEIIADLGHTLRWWMVGQLISMMILFITTWVMLWLLGVPLAFALGLITGLLTFIPYLGPIIALVPILLITLVESPTLALTVLALYMVIQNVEANIIMPIIFKKTVHLPPALTIVAQILLGGMLGMIGIILATPLLASGIVLVRTIYVEDVIGDDMEKPVEQCSA
jgi:predicted PurR-regulated permease PerM